MTLVFSSYYLNNPASAFGHTFLRFNRAHTTAIGERRELLDYGIDYSADVDTGNAVLYAIKGMTGLFPGTFKRIPFFYKVREYNDYESRDLWEYELNLAPEQLALLPRICGSSVTPISIISISAKIARITSSRCSRSRNPDLDLMTQSRVPFPADTIKACTRTRDWCAAFATGRRCANSSNRRVALLDGEERGLVEELAHDPISAAARPERRAQGRGVDAAADFIDVLYARELIDKTDTAAAAKKQRVLERRAEILRPSQPLVLPTPWQEAPEHGHGRARSASASRCRTRSSRRARTSSGVARPGRSTPGYLELIFESSSCARLQLWPSGRIQLDDGVLFSVISLTPQSRFQRRMSWHFELGATRSRTTPATNAWRRTDDRSCSGQRLVLGQRRCCSSSPRIAAMQWDARDRRPLGNSHFRLGIGPNREACVCGSPRA